MLKFRTCQGLLSVALSLLLGCSQSGPVPKDLSSPVAAPASTYLLTEKPEHIQGVAEARNSATNGDEASGEIAVEGRIGGSEKPFVDGVAAFTIVDPAIPYCQADEGCPTPWDYCCQTDQLKTGTALVKIVGADGNPILKDARELLGVKELSRVVVLGKASRDEAGNLTVLAEKIHITRE